MKTKKDKVLEESHENKQYDDMAHEHMKLLGEREKQKQDSHKEKIMNDKLSRDI